MEVPVVQYPVDPEALWDHAEELVEELVDSGTPVEEAAASVARFLDGVLPFDVLIPGVLGQVAEAVDEPLFKRIVGFFIGLMSVDPEKRAERRAHRAVRQRDRERKREARKAERKERRKQRKALDEAPE